MPSVFIQDDAVRRAKQGILYDFVAPDGSESRDAADVIYARFQEFNKGIRSSDDYLDFKLSVEALSGGTNTVILDDRGLPSVMVLLPKMDSANLSNGLESRIHPGFIVDGKVHDTVAIGKYVSYVKDGRAYSMPYKDPANMYTFDESVSFCRDKGRGWGIVPLSLWSAIALWCKKNGTMPEGNTNYGQFNDDATSCAPAAEVDKDGRTMRTLTGAGPLSWFHNYRRDGIADMVGNVHEWVSGFRFCNGELQIIPDADAMNPDCDLSFTSDRWRAILPDGSLTNPGNKESLKFDYVKFPDRNEDAFYGDVNGRWVVSQTVTSAQDKKKGGCIREIGLADGLKEAPQILIELGLFPERLPTGAPYGNDIFSGPNWGEEFIPAMGGQWYDYTYWCGGIFRHSSWYERSLRGNTYGMRLAYYNL
ncbi:MAG: hypothetical protein IJA11_00465 [Oscillospiraceae bacterium]|nr:hypothetical protein [Oscillospiraceae bacterium]